MAQKVQLLQANFSFKKFTLPLSFKKSKIKFMKTLKIISAILFLFAISFSANAQTNTGSLYLIRLTGSTGVAINYHFYVDGELICKLKNKSFSVHQLTPGEHTVSIGSGGLSNGKKSEPLKITVVEGKTNYVNVVGTQSGYVNKLSCQEITQSSAEPLLAKSKQKTDCEEKE
jgi:hypothetical protein